MSLIPHITVATIIEQNGRFLMVEEMSEGRKVLNQPAGHLEANESLIEAAIRETLEETAWHVEITAVTGIHQWTLPGTDRHYLRICFAGIGLKHDPNYTMDPSILDTHWISRDELAANPERLRSPLVLPCIDEYLAGQRLPLDILKYHDR